MNIVSAELDGVFIIEPNVFEDARGFFYESYSEFRYREYGLKESFVQDNFSKSKKNTVRGLHYQVGNHPQGKLVSVLMGDVLDVAVDIRFGSPSFGKHVSVVLSANNHRQFWIPQGFAHGFSVLSDEAIVHYKCTDYFSKIDERGFRYNDSDLGIDWQVDAPIVSEKDQNARAFRDIERDFEYSG